MERFPEEETTEENLDDEREEFRSLAKNIAGDEAGVSSNKECQGRQQRGQRE